MPDIPLVIQVMAEYKAALIAGDLEQITRMSQVWFQVERRLAAEVDALALEAEILRQQGETLNAGKLAQMERYQSLLAQAQAESRKYARWASDQIEARQRELGRLGINQASEAIRAAYVGAGQIAGVFGRLPVDAMQFMAGLAGDGSPLYSMLVETWPESVERLTRALVEGVALGHGPRVIAANMRAAMGRQLDRALAIARTETLRVYREAARAQYRASRVVGGYMRMSARDRRTCIACLLKDGEVFPLDEPFAEHPQGRCVPVPVVLGLPAIEWPDGKTWFLKQDEAYQLELLGPGRYQAWKNGEFALENVVMRKRDAVWGDAFVPRSLYELTGG